MSSGPWSVATSRPSKAIVPAVGVSCSRISLDVVVLPQPDSPMSPSVSPAWMVKSTPSTAFTTLAPPSSRCRAGKCFFKFRASRTGDAIAHQPAAGDAVVAGVNVLRLVGRAAREHFRAARVKGAARGQAGEVRRLARDRVERLLAAELRHR